LSKQNAENKGERRSYKFSRIVEIYIPLKKEWKGSKMPGVSLSKTQRISHAKNRENQGDKSLEGKRIWVKI